MPEIASPLRGLRSPFGSRQDDPIAALRALLLPGASNLLLFDNTDPATMWQDLARTLPVTGLAQPVRIQNDLSGFGNHRLQPTTDADRPLWNANAQGRRGLNFNGANSWLRTETFTPGSDKCQMFGVWQKVNDTTGMVVELSANANSNNGSLWLVSGSESGGNGWHSFARGSVGPTVEQTARAVPFAGTDTAVLAITHDIAGDLSTIQRNGVNGASSVADKGAGSFGTHQMFFGRRGGTNIAFNGWTLAFEAYRFGPNLSAQQIAQVVTLLNQVAGGVF